MNQQDIANIFRRTELENRARRREALLRSEAALEHEQLDAQAKTATVHALDSIRRQQVAYEQATRLGYWRRLWYALINKRSQP